MLAGYPPFYDENPFGIYQKILQGKLEFPRHFETHARDLVTLTLTCSSGDPNPHLVTLSRAR